MVQKKDNNYCKIEQKAKIITIFTQIIVSNYVQFNIAEYAQDFADERVPRNEAKHHVIKLKYGMQRKVFETQEYEACSM